MELPVRVGVIGAGVVGTHHALLYSQIPGYQLAGVFDPDAAKAARIAQQCGGVAFQTLYELLDTVDAATIASPATTHPAVVLRALDAGLHLLIANPMAASIDDAKRIVELARESDRVLMVGQTDRFNPAFIGLRKILVGKRVRHVTFTRVAPFDCRCLDADVVSDLMIHDISLVQSLFGSEIISMAADGEAVQTNQTDRSVVSLLLPYEIHVTLFASRVGESHTRQIDVIADGIRMLVDLLRQSISIERITPSGGHCVGNQCELMLGEPSRRELQHFLNCIRGLETPQIDASCGYRELEWVDRINSLIERHERRNLG